MADIEVLDMPVRMGFLAGCGILEKEISFLIKKNGWDFNAIFLPSALHIDFHKLEKTVKKVLDQVQNESGVLFYGECHPCMKEIISNYNVTRTTGQNCVDIYLGHERFCEELGNGAFFLFEDWAKKWEHIVGAAIPGNPEVMKSIFKFSHKYLLAISTPCSGDFVEEAEKVSRMTGLPLVWCDASLYWLEKSLESAITAQKNSNAK